MTEKEVLGTIKRFHSKNRVYIKELIYRNISQEVKGSNIFLGMHKLDQNEIDEMVNRLSKPTQCKKEQNKTQHETIKETRSEEKKITVKKNIKRLTQKP